MAEIEEEMRALQEEQARVPDEDEQKQMFARRSANEGYGGGYGFRRSAASPVSNDPDIAALLGRSPDISSSPAPRSRGDELLSMMFDDEPLEESPVETPFVGREEQPATQTPPKIPDITRLEDTTLVEPEPEATPPAVEPEPEATPPAVEPEPEATPPAVEPEPEATPPAVEPEPEATPPAVEPEPEATPPAVEPEPEATPPLAEEEPPQDPDSIEMKASCSSCSTSFKVRIPSGAPGVRVPCPACGSIEVVRRP